MSAEFVALLQAHIQATYHMNTKRKTKQYGIDVRYIKIYYGLWLV
jgi:hypothetical protein